MGKSPHIPPESIWAQRMVGNHNCFAPSLMYLDIVQDAMPAKIHHYSTETDYSIVLGWDLSHFTLVLPSLFQETAAEVAGEK